jgi:hypothetical protein
MATKGVAKVEPLDMKLEVVVLGVSEFLPYTSNTMSRKILEFFFVRPNWSLPSGADKVATEA